MRFYLGILVSISVALGLVVACDKSNPVVNPVVTPKGYDLNDPVFAFAKEEYEREVAQCGPGVVEGATGENKCTYQIKLDALFFKHPAAKTGFLPDPNWPYKQGVNFVEPNAGDVPDTFDIRDLMTGGLPQLHNQVNGDCWANATTSGLELSRSVADGHPTNHSTQTVISCSKAGTASGGGTMDAVEFLLHGLPFETDWPYVGRDLPCKYSSSQIQSGWDGKVIAAPFIGNSFNHSRFFKESGFKQGSKVGLMKQAIYQWKAGLVVTVDAYSISGDGVYNSCGAINSQGNHMVVVTGWDAATNAHVWNSWGPSHGKNGVSRIKWECGDGRLNHGLGVEARIVQYKTPCQTPVPFIEKPKYQVLEGGSIKLGKPAAQGVTCSWNPAVGLSNPNACETFATPDKSTEYHLTAKNDCGSASAMTLIEVWGPKTSKNAKPSEMIRTPFGEVRAY